MSTNAAVLCYSALLPACSSLCRVADRQEKPAGHKSEQQERLITRTKKWKATTAEKRLLSPTEELGELISGFFLACCGVQAAVSKEDYPHDDVKSKDDSNPNPAQFAKPQYTTFDVETSATSTGSIDTLAVARYWSTSEGDDDDSSLSATTTTTTATTTPTVPAPNSDLATPSGLLGHTAALMWAPVTLASSLIPTTPFQGEQQRPPHPRPVLPPRPSVAL